jgi:hypothetical protein
VSPVGTVNYAFAPHQPKTRNRKRQKRCIPLVIAPHFVGIYKKDPPRRFADHLRRHDHVAHGAAEDFGRRFRICDHGVTSPVGLASVRPPEAFMVTFKQHIRTVMLSSRDAQIIKLWVENQPSSHTRWCYRHDSEQLLNHAKKPLSRITLARTAGFCRSSDDLGPGADLPRTHTGRRQELVRLLPSPAVLHPLWHIRSPNRRGC